MPNHVSQLIVDVFGNIAHYMDVIYGKKGVNKEELKAVYPIPWDEVIRNTVSDNGLTPGDFVRIEEACADHALKVLGSDLAAAVQRVVGEGTMAGFIKGWTVDENILDGHTLSTTDGTREFSFHEGRSSYSVRVYSLDNKTWLTATVKYGIDGEIQSITTVDHVRVIIDLSENSNVISSHGDRREPQRLGDLIPTQLSPLDAAQRSELTSMMRTAKDERLMPPENRTIVRRVLGNP